MIPLTQIRLALQLATRSARQHLRKTAIIAVLTLVQAFVLTGGLALYTSMRSAMQRAIVDTIAGDFQIYSTRTDHDVELFGPGVGQEIPFKMSGFPRVRQALRELPEVKEVVAMGGGDFTYFSLPSPIEETVTALATASKAGDRTKWGRSINRLLEQLHYLRQDYAEMTRLRPFDQEISQGLHDIDSILAPEWKASCAEPSPQCVELCEAEILPLTQDANQQAMRVFGVDFKAYARAAKRLKIVDGSMVPEGHRGLLLNKTSYENVFKHPAATLLDEIKENVTDGVRISDSPRLQIHIEQTAELAQEMLVELDVEQREQLRGALAKFLGAQGDAAELLERFLRVDDSNFSQRYDFFYAELAPLFRLYRAAIGDKIVIRYAAANGLPTLVEVPLYGTFEFEGLSRSPMTVGYSFIDMLSLSELLGIQPDDEAAAAESQPDTPAKESDDLEAALFDSDAAATISEVSSEKFDVEIDPVEHTHSMRFSKREIDKVPVPHAAVFLKDGAAVENATAQIRSVARRFGLQISSWQRAAGPMSGFASIIGAIIAAVIIILFVVSSAIINSVVMMLLLDRTGEIGALRAIGAQKGFVRWLLLLEMLTLAGVAGLIGALTAAAAISVLGHTGISAGAAPILRFVFGGEALFPKVTMLHVAGGALLTMAMVALATAYPAHLMTRILPVEAMRRTESLQ